MMLKLMFGLSGLKCHDWGEGVGVSLPNQQAW